MSPILIHGWKIYVYLHNWSNLPYKFTSHKIVFHMSVGMRNAITSKRLSKSSLISSWLPTLQHVVSMNLELPYFDDERHP